MEEKNKKKDEDIQDTQDEDVQDGSTRTIEELMKEMSYEDLLHVYGYF